VTEMIYGDDGEEYELVDDDGLTPDEVAAFRAAVAAVERGEYADEDEYADEADEEAEWLNALAADCAALEMRIGRQLTQSELNTLTGFAEATGVRPSDAYGNVTPELDLSNENDRIALAAQVIDEDEERLQRQDAQEAAGLTHAENAALLAAGGYGAEEEETSDYGGEPA